MPDAAAQRSALERHGADAAAVAEVMGLLGHTDRPTHFSVPLAQAARLLDDALHERDALGARTLQGTLGHGGMARVYLPVRSDGHHEQRAALKLLADFTHRRFPRVLMRPGSPGLLVSQPRGLHGLDGA